MLVAQVFEAAMLICFGCSWPAALAKTLRVRKVHGQSVLFLFMVFLGYLSGVAAKVTKAILSDELPDWVTILYAANALMVAMAIVLYFRFHEPDDRPGLTIEPESPGVEVTEEPRDL